MKKILFTCFFCSLYFFSFGKLHSLDSLFRQREITIITESFPDYKELVESVIVSIKKTHQNGNISKDEIIINQENYSENENFVKLKYDWKGDDKSIKWLEYEYEVIWYLVDGRIIHLPTKKTDSFAIFLISPWRKTQVEIEIDAELLKKIGVNLITMHLYYKVGEKEISKQIVFNPFKSKLFQEANVFISGNDNLYYEYDINWILNNNKMISSGRKKGTDPYIFVGEPTK